MFGRVESAKRIRVATATPLRKDVAISIAPDSDDCDSAHFGWVGPVFVLALVALVTIAELADVFGWRPLSSRWSSVGLIALSLAVAAVAAKALGAFGGDHGRRLPETVGWDRWGLMSLLPGAVLVAYAVQRQLALPRSDRVEWFLGGDHVRHLLLVVEERATGSLSYTHEVYPRAWQTLLTAVWSASGAQPGSASGLVSLIDLMSTAVWLLFALLVVVTGQLATTLAHRVGLQPRAAGLAGLTAGSLALLPSFLGNYQVLGFENSILAAVLLAVVARELLARPESLNALVLCGASIALMANTWQLLLPAVGASFAFCAIAVVRRLGRAGLGWVGTVGMLAAAIGAPGMLAVVRGVGVGHASDAGVVAPLPLVLLPLGLLALIIVLLHWSRELTVLGFAVLASLPGLTGLGLAVRVGIPPTQYYPSKLIWHTALLGLAPLGVLVAYGIQTLRRRPSVLATGTRAAATVALAVVVAYAFAAPLGAQFHKWSTVHGGPVLAALTTPGAQSAQVVWLSTGRLDGAIARLFLDYYRADDTSQRTPQAPLSVAAECRLLKASGSATVLSDQPSSAVAARYRCVGGVRTLAVRWRVG